MQKIKKLLCTFCIVLLGASIVGGCSKNERETNIEGDLSSIMDKLYTGLDEQELPMMLENISLNEENFENFAFTKVEFKEAIASEAMTGSTPHSVVLIRLEDEKDAKEAVESIKEKADPRKWICVEAENTYVLSKGDLVVLIMSNEAAPKIKENFENLK